MYVSTHRSAKGTKALGVVAAGVLTVGLAGLFTSMNFAAEKAKLNTTELVILLPPPPPPPIEEPKPKVEVVKDTPAPPEPPPLVAPEIDFVPEELPVITAPVADPIPVPEPVYVAPAPPAPVSQSTPKLLIRGKPDYPSASRRAGEQGTTHLEVCVNSGGRVTSVSVAGSSGHQRLDDAAASWIRGERFTPGKINGTARDVCGYDVFYEWTLRDA
jgi:periplasmic protein TonB